MLKIQDSLGSNFFANTHDNLFQFLEYFYTHSV